MRVRAEHLLVRHRRTTLRGCLVWNNLLRTHTPIGCLLAPGARGCYCAVCFAYSEQQSEVGVQRAAAAAVVHERSAAVVRKRAAAVVHARSAAVAYERAAPVFFA